MQYFTRLVYTLIVIIISIPALSSIFIFFGISLEVYASYLMWMAAVALFSSILAPNTEIPKLITLLGGIRPGNQNTSDMEAPTSIPTLAPVPINRNVDTNIIPVKGFFKTLIGITEPGPYNTEPPVTSESIGNTNTNKFNNIIPVKGFINKFTDIFKSDNIKPYTSEVKTTTITPKKTQVAVSNNNNNNNNNNNKNKRSRLKEAEGPVAAAVDTFNVGATFHSIANFFI